MKTDMDGFLPVRIGVLLFFIAGFALLLTGCSSEPGNPALYAKYCASCHGPDGEGLRSLYPALQGSEYLAQRIHLLPCVITTGVPAARTAGTKNKMVMPSFSHLSLDDMTGLIEYLHGRWGPNDKTPTREEVNTWLKSCR